MRTIIPRPVDRLDWLELRTQYFNASAAACLYDRHPFQSLGDWAVNKLTGEVGPENRAMNRGTRLEAAVAEWFSDEVGLALYEPDVVFVCDDVLMATLDRVVVGGSHLVEIKTTSKRISAPEQYWLDQVQAQLLCTGFDSATIVVLDATMDLTTFDVQADAEFGADLLERATKAMAYIRRGEVPPEADLDFRAVARLHPADPGAAPVELEAEVAHAVDELAEVRDRLRQLGVEEEELKSVIALALGSATVGTYKGKPLVTWRSVTRSGIDVVQLRRQYPDVAAEFATSTTFRNMSLSKVRR